MGTAATTNPIMIDKASYLLNDVDTKEFVIKKVDKFMEENGIIENVGKYIRRIFFFLFCTIKRTQNNKALRKQVFKLSIFKGQSFLNFIVWLFSKKKITFISYALYN